MRGRADRLDDHAGVLALDEVAERAGGEGLAHDVGLGVGAHQHDLDPGGLERRDLERDRDVVFEVEVEQHDVDRELRVREQLGPGGHGGDHVDVVGGVADPLGERAEQHPVVVDEREADAVVSRSRWSPSVLVSWCWTSVMVGRVVDEALDVDAKAGVLGVSQCTRPTRPIASQVGRVDTIPRARRWW